MARLCGRVIRIVENNNLVARRARAGGLRKESNSGHARPAKCQRAGLMRSNGNEWDILGASSRSGFPWEVTWITGDKKYAPESLLFGKHRWPSWCAMKGAGQSEDKEPFGQPGTQLIAPLSRTRAGEQHREGATSHAHGRLPRTRAPRDQLNPTKVSLSS